MDDLLLDPGIQLGDFPVSTCEEGLALLASRTLSGKAAEDPAYELARLLLTAELNLGTGAETCPIAEEAVVGGHLVLSNIGFTGNGEYAAAFSDEIANAIPTLIQLLDAYNIGELCR